MVNFELKSECQYLLSSCVGKWQNTVFNKISQDRLLLTNVAISIFC